MQKNSIPQGWKLFLLVGNKTIRKWKMIKEGQEEGTCKTEPYSGRGEETGKEPEEEDEEKDEHWKREGWISIQDEEER